MMRAALLEFKYMDPLVTELKLRGYEIVRTTPEKSLYMYLSRLVDLAIVSSVASSSLALEPCLTCPAVYSLGRVENVKLKFLNKKRRVKLWVTPKSYTGRALARWFLEKEGFEYVCVNKPEEADVILEIGDAARELEGDVVDLGEAWYAETGEPLVYAVTLSRRPESMEEVYTWRNIGVTPLVEVVDAYLATVKLLREHWVKPLYFSRGLLGLLLRSLK